MSDTTAGIDTGTEIELDGFALGASAAVEALTPGWPEVHRASFVEDMVREYTTNPAWLASVRAQVRERLEADPAVTARDALDAELADRLDIDAGLAEAIGDCE